MLARFLRMQVYENSKVSGQMLRCWLHGRSGKKPISHLLARSPCVGRYRQLATSPCGFCQMPDQEITM